MYEIRASDLLADFLRGARIRIDDVLAVEKSRTAVGNPGRSYRNHLVARLLTAYPDIFGEPPTTTPGGRLLQLCELIVEHLGEDTDGLEFAVRRVSEKPTTACHGSSDRRPGSARW